MLNFLAQYLRHPRSVGAVAPSGRGLTRKMMEPIRFDRARTIVEYGPGTGSFTAELCRRIRPGTRLVLIEQNDAFYRTILERFGSADGVTVIHGSAAEADRYLADLGITTVDYVVSGLPFASLPKQVSLQIFRATQRILGPRGRFITFQYTLFKQRFFKQHFYLEEKLFERWNLPPAFVFVCRNL